MEKTTSIFKKTRGDALRPAILTRHYKVAVKEDVRKSSRVPSGVLPMSTTSTAFMREEPSSCLQHKESRNTNEATYVGMA